MGLLQRIAMRFAVKALPKSFNGFWWGSAGTGDTTFANAPTGWVQAVNQNVWARNCVAARAYAVTKAPMKLYRGRGDKKREVIDHPVLDLLRDVNGINLNAKSFRMTIERQLAIHGTCYILKFRAMSVGALYVLPAHLVMIEPDANNFIAGYRYAVNNVLYDPKDVIRLWYQGDDGTPQANSPTHGALGAINRYQMADTAQEAIDKRGGQGGGIVTYDATYLNIDRMRLSEEWDAKRSDPKNAGRDIHMPQGTDYKSGVLTAQEQQREERMMRLAKEIMAAYSVPPSIAGDYSDASMLANAAVQSRHFWELWAIPELEMIAEELTYSLLHAEYEGSEDLYFEHDLSEIPALQEDASERAQRAVLLLQGGIITVNEAREMTNNPHIDDPRADDVTVLTEATTPTMPPAASVKALPVVADYVGMTLVTPDGDKTVEKIVRFGAHLGREATKAAPLFIMREGGAYYAEELTING